MALQAMALLVPAILCQPNPPDRNSLAQRARMAVEKLSSLSFEAEMHCEEPRLFATADDGKRDVHVSVRMKCAGKLRVEASSKGKRLWVLLSDGEHVVEWSGEENKWTRYDMPAPESGKGLCRTLLINSATGVHFFDTPRNDERFGYGKWLQQVIARPDASLLGLRNIDGMVRVVIEMKNTERQDESPASEWTSETVRFYLDPDTYLLARYKSVVAVGYGPIRLGKGIVDIRYEDINANAELPDDIFVFTPPSGSTFVSPDDPRFQRPVFEGRPAPDLSLPDLDGKTFTLAELKGKKAVVLVFWATWCQPCNAEMPVLIRLSKEYEDPGLVVIGISTDKNSYSVKNFVRTKGLPYLNLHDKDGTAAKLFDAKSIPRTFLIDKNGNVVKDWQGWSGDKEEKEIREEVAKLLAAGPTTVPENQAGPGASSLFRPR